MRSDEGNASDGARIDRLRHRPGSRRSRLGDANKQLAILLEGVDLQAEPALGEALTEAVIAVDRASELVRGRERGRRRRPDVEDRVEHRETAQKEGTGTGTLTGHRGPRLVGGSSAE